MWFRRKTRNRRLGRQYVLEVKLRSSQVRAARVRMALVALTVVFAAVLGVFVVWWSGQLALNRLVYENPSFAIENIEIQTDGVLAPDQIRRWAGVRPGQNLLALDLGSVKRDLELVSVIDRASVERVLPHTLRIRVSEREPLAQLTVPRPGRNGHPESALLYLDADGFVLSPLQPQQRAIPAPQPAEPLPLITGLDPNFVQVGHALDSAQVHAALDLLLAFERSSMASVAELKSVDVASPEVLVATTTQGSLVTFGLTNLDRQLRRWREIFDECHIHNLAIADLDLAVTNNIPARWLQASAVPPLPPKRIKTSRKRHV
ncbi:MAG TPA: FtsQ-type POTRA domain-containing protein [Verrucomicrobiae bacterium]|nr:FtsQ-type POTRA domain-containing protein [Verrucomicrobiae bacterium]